MRYLLKKDQVKYISLNNWIRENWGKRKPDLTQGKQMFCATYDMRDMDGVLYYHRSRGGEATIEDVFKGMANERPEFVVSEITIEANEKDKMYTAKGVLHPTSNDFMSKWNKKAHYDMLIARAESYMTNFMRDKGYHDSRNLYEGKEGIYYGTRGRNEDNPRLLGDIVSGTLIMSHEEYETILTDFANTTPI
jgi:hypothetical protein